MDRRLVLANDRFVTRALADHFPALTPVTPRQYTVIAPVADVLRRPDGPRDRQFRWGDPFEVIEQRDGYAFGLGPESFPYAGWIKQGDLAPLRPDPAGDPAFVITRQTHAYCEPDFKSAETIALPHLAQVDIQAHEGRFSKTNAGWIPSRHLSADSASDPVAIAALYLGTPYLWGGNSSWGIDCSGLVQAGLIACGLPCPGDSDQQEAILGKTLPPGTPYRRGDLLFWKGHVAWVSDPDTLLHANAFHMATTYEPIAEALPRIKAQGDGPVTRHARLL